MKTCRNLKMKNARAKRRCGGRVEHWFNESKHQAAAEQFASTMRNRATHTPKNLVSGFQICSWLLGDTIRYLCS